MGAPKIAFCDSHLGLMNKGSVDEVVYRKMALVISSCWFYITNSLFFVISFIAMHIFRIKTDDSPQRDDSSGLAMKDSNNLERFPESTKLEEWDCSFIDEEETSCFSFKFQHQFSEDTMRTSGELTIPVTSGNLQSTTADGGELTNPVTGGNLQSTTSDIHEYRFLSDKAFSGFMEEPKAMTFFVQESYVDSREGNINDNKEPNTKDFQQFNNFSESNELEKPNDVIPSKSKLLEEKTPLGSKANSMDGKDFSGFTEEPEAMAFHAQESSIDCGGEIINDKEKSDLEFTTRFLSTKDFDQSNNMCENEAKESEDAIPFKTNSLDEKEFSVTMEETESQESHVDCSIDDMSGKEKLYTEFTTRYLSAKDIDQSTSIRKLNKSKESEDVMLFKNKHLDEELPLSCDTSSLDEKEVSDGVRILSEGFSGFDSDTESVSLSDGYSVKNLVVDTDSDGFLSERDFGGHELESDTAETSFHFNRQKIDQQEDIGEFNCQLQALYNSGTLSADTRGGFAYIKNQTNYEGIDKGFLPKKRLYKPKNKSEEELHNHREVLFPCASTLQIEFTDSSDDQRSSLGTDSTRSSTSDEVFYVKDLNCPESQHKNLGGEDDGTISQIQSFEANHLHNLHHSDTEFDASTSRCSAPTNSPEQTDATQLGIDSDELACKPEDLQGKEKTEEDLEKSEEAHLEDLDSEDLDELESLWEHQELIEQLKMELRKVRATGLPTIFEESESPKSIEDLKPWKIDENFLREDPMDELHKFYKSYRERMRKFDILNYQKMYAIGFLQLKDPLQSMGSQKPLIPTMMSHLSHSFWPFYRRKSNNDPSEKFLKELQSDLETVYVGQTCLSWEFLHWQYEKARGLPESDPYRCHQYNQVAGEFQQFQVIIQRFVENESFQGPRLPNYVKNRCVLRNLLQVPVIKEDCLKDKMEEQRKGDYVIRSEMLEDIMEESIRIFWEFVKADKNETPMILKSLIGTHVELQDPSDFKLMVDIEAILQKKEKKLKDILRTGNCLVKKFKKPQEDRSNLDLFFSQVDMKLVSMVLKMSRITTDQLVWCHRKLSKITFAERKISREPSFLLFPC